MKKLFFYVRAFSCSKPSLEEGKLLVLNPNFVVVKYSLVVYGADRPYLLLVKSYFF